MGKKHIIKLEIPTPCHENWDNMTPNERGRHCDSCNKTVIDFSLFNDRQLIEFLTKTKGSICGRLNKFQLENQLVYVEPAKNHFLYKLLFGTALVTGIASANANYNPNSKPLIENLGFRQALEKAEQPPAGDTTHFISGMVFDTVNHVLVPFAIVAIKGTLQSVQTDMNGRFKLFVPLKYRKKTIKLECIYSGYVQEITVVTTKLPLTTFIKLEHPQLNIEAKIETTSITKHSFTCVETESSSIGLIGIRIEETSKNKYEPEFPYETEYPNPDKQTLHKGDTPYW